MKALFTITLTILTYVTVVAQNQTENKPPQNKPMPNYLPDKPPTQIPNLRFDGGSGVDPQSGKLQYYLDTETRLYFDFEDRVVRDFQTGKMYTFEELRDKFQRREKEPKRLEKKLL